MPVRLAVLIGERIRAIRESKDLTQGDIEERCGLFRFYISRLENGHIVPSVGTLEKLARALEVRLSQLFYEGKERPGPRHLLKRKAADEITWGTNRKEIDFWRKLRGLLARMTETDRELLFHMGQKDGLAVGISFPSTASLKYLLDTFARNGVQAQPRIISSSNSLCLRS